jgi:peptide/nickel transport system ATP-binding protein
MPLDRDSEPFEPVPPMEADPRDTGGPRQPMLIVRDLTKHFPIGGQLPGRRSAVHAADGVSFDVFKGETLGIVGESGCGKSTTARLLIRLIKPDSGAVIFDGQEVGVRAGISVRDMQRQVQMVFQDSYASLNPRLTLRDSVSFGLRVGGMPNAEAKTRADDTLRLVGLAPENFAQRFPHELSGGQRQRVNIARALAMQPRVLILDEAVSALDKSIEAQVLNLLQELKERLSLTYVFISHDLNVVRYISDRLLVMYLGKVVEIGPVDQIYRAPRHPYTRALLSSRPSMDPANRRSEPPLTGDPPSPIDPPPGCRFRARCPLAETICEVIEPPLAEQGAGHHAACHALAPGSGHSAAPAY